MGGDQVTGSQPPNERELHATFRRTPGVVWRVAANRVLLRRVGDISPEAAAEVTGSAAVVWHALSEPLDAGQLADELRAAGCEDPATELTVALRVLGEHQLVQELHDT